MPKVLNLKKTHQTASPKNQKAITHFFKSTTITASTQIQDSPSKPNSAQTKCTEKNHGKRKVLSSAGMETIDMLVVDGVNIIASSNLNKTNGFHNKSKKLKLDSSTNSPTKNVEKRGTLKKSKSKTMEKSPLKENHVFTKLPTKKRSKESLTKPIQTETNENEEFQVTKDRSPLTPVKTDNVNVIAHSESLVRLTNNIIIESSSNVNQTPNKVLYFQNCGKKSTTILKTPNKSLYVKSPEKLTIEEVSPSKSGSTIKTLEETYDVHNDFGDEWDMADIDVDCSEDLDLSTMQRCEVISVICHATRIEMRLKNHCNNKATCFVEGVWLDTPLVPGEIVSIIAPRDANNQFCVGNSGGLLTLRPDQLMSATSVVAGVFCKRKAVLQERWRGLDPANTAMTIGILIHELVQKALTENIMDNSQLNSETEKIIKESIQMLYDAGLTEEGARHNIQTYIPSLADFMRFYVADKPEVKQPQKDQWNGHIDKVLDIEENMCCPQLGLKGKIDATLQVTIHERKGKQKATMPLELKSGKASVSAEHRGQLVLYGMMLSSLRGEDPTTAEQRGLLLYLKERVDLREVSCGYPERRDLVMLRNQLVQYLAPGPDDIDPEYITDIEDTCLLQQRLPDPVHHENACARCPYLTICSIHLWHTDGPSVSESHPLSKLQGQALGHLSPDHIKYFLRWAALLKMEERTHNTAAPLRALWTDSVEKRTKRGTCAANLKLVSVKQSGDRHLHIFKRKIKEIDTLNSDGRGNKGPQEGEFSIVSLDNRPWIAAGVVTMANEKEISIVLERDLSRRSKQGSTFHIDTYESYAATVQNLTNLGVLLEDSDRALRLRRLIIDKEPPQFAKKLPREVGRLGTRLMKSLNIQQQRAVLRALAAMDYALLQGLPGTGKTETISVLIQMLVGLKKKVLVSAHTHSAVDTVLNRLPETLRIMRLGSSTRVSASLKDRCEEHLAASCKSPAELKLLYDSMEVVGVTCLGAAHALLTRTTFDVCIVDEATQVLQCTVLRPLLGSACIVLVGDPDQLPPVVRSRAARRLGMEESLFHRLTSEVATSTLQLQYRMNQALADIANKVAYDSRLKCANQKVANATLDIDLQKIMHYSSDGSTEWLLKVCSPQSEVAALFLDMMPFQMSDNKGCSNLEEACVVVRIVDVLIEGGVKPTNIGVIAPYRDQVSLLRKVAAYRSVECSTVDQFQGRDKSVIIYSCTKREGEDREVKEGEILDDQRRLAVSVTRAKHKLVVIGNSRAVHRYKPLQKLIDACSKLCLESDVIKSVVNKYRAEFV